MVNEKELKDQPEKPWRITFSSVNTCCSVSIFFLFLSYSLKQKKVNFIQKRLCSSIYSFDGGCDKKKMQKNVMNMMRERKRVKIKINLNIIQFLDFNMPKKRREIQRRGKFLC